MGDLRIGHNILHIYHGGSHYISRIKQSCKRIFPDFNSFVFTVIIWHIDSRGSLGPRVPGSVRVGNYSKRWRNTVISEGTLVQKELLNS